MKKTLSVLMTLMFLSVSPFVLSETGSVPEMSLLVINVGKADCLLLRSGSTAYLIDTGTKKTADRVLEVLAACGVTRLDGIILTHTHSDHAGGLKSIIESGFPVDAVYAPAFYTLKKETGKHPAEKALKNSTLEVTWLRAGDELPLDSGSLRVLGPIEQDEEDENNNSLVLLAEGGGGTMLLTGDMEFPEEASLLRAGVLSPADVLKIGNHGEGDATSEQFLSAVKPSLAVISTNTEEEPDTPDPRVISLLGRMNIPVLQTQETETGVLVILRGGEILTEMK